MKGRDIGVVLFLVALVTLGLSPGVRANECDDPTSTPYTPTVDMTETLINSVIHLFDTMSLEGASFPKDISFLCPHTIVMEMGPSTTVRTENLNLLATPGMGSFEVLVDMNGSEASPFFEGTARIADVEHHGGILCILEDWMFDLLVGDDYYPMKFDSGTLTQETDVCVTADCEAVHPLIDGWGVYPTDTELEGLFIEMFDSSWLDWMNHIVSFFASIMVNVAGLISEEFEVDGEGLLVNIFHTDIVSDGCSPEPAILECTGAACSTVVRDGPGTAGRSVNVLFYLLPLAVMFGLILWRRKKRQVNP